MIEQTMAVKGRCRAIRNEAGATRAEHRCLKGTPTPGRKPAKTILTKPGHAARGTAELCGWRRKVARRELQAAQAAARGYLPPGDEVRFDRRETREKRRNTGFFREFSRFDNSNSVFAGGRASGCRIRGGWAAEAYVGCSPWAGMRRTTAAKVNLGKRKFGRAAGLMKEACVVARGRPVSSMGKYEPS